MEENNPKLVLDAVTEYPAEFDGVKVNDITIFRYAYLEKIRSPFIDSSVDFTVENLVPSIYVLAADKKDLRKYSSDIEALKLDALEWADDHLSFQNISKVIDCITRKFQDMNKAAPSGGDSKKN